MAPPLRKRTREGVLYARDSRLEAELSELESLTDAALLERCRLARGRSGHVSDEALLTFARDKAGHRTQLAEPLFKLLLARARLYLPRAEHGETRSMGLANIRDETFDRFVDLLLEDRQDYAERLDYFEVRFGSAMASIRLDARQRVERDEKRSVPLDDEGSEGGLTHEVEAAAGSYDPFDPDRLDDSRYRSRLDAAIDALPPEQRRIIEMLRLDIPIDSKDPDVQTIAKTLNRSEKTIRIHRDKAFAALRTLLLGGKLE